MTELKPALARLGAWRRGESAYIAYRGKAPAGTPTMNADLALVLAEAEKLVLIDALRAGEGDCVTICSDNADFDGPNSAVEVVGEWTNWMARMFSADSVLDALRAAVAAKDRK